MRKITSEAVRAFEWGNNYKGSNTEVKNNGEMYLFGNLIARHVPGGYEITNAGWQSATTKERLNAIQGVHIVQKAGEWYLNGNLWNGSWITIKI